MLTSKEQLENRSSIFENGNNKGTVPAKQNKVTQRGTKVSKTENKKLSQVEVTSVSSPTRNSHDVTAPPNAVDEPTD